MTMTPMLDAASIEALNNSLMLGTRRHPAPVQKAFGGLIEADDPKAVLKALALLGQHNRFRRPARASAISATPLFADERSTIAEQARPLLLGLLAGKDAGMADSVPLAIADAMERRRLKLHPFDLPRLETFVKAYADQLGASAVAWSERSATIDASEAYSFVDSIDETNWSRGRPVQKAAFIRGLRATDPTRARALVEGALAGEKAPVRLALIRAIRENLSADDRSFLEGLAKDRAPSVREAVEELLARMPGSPQAAKHLADCLSRIKKTKTGLLRRRVTLQLDYPATVKDWAREAWAIATFGRIGLDDFAKGLDVSIDGIVAAAADDPVLMVVLAAQATQARRYEVLEQLARAGAPCAWSTIVQAPDLDLSADAAAWSAAAIQPEYWETIPIGGTHLYRVLRQPLPQATAERLLASKAWRSTLEAAEQTRSPLLFESVAVLMPASLRGPLCTDLARIPAEFTTRALNTLSLLELIEAA